MATGVTNNERLGPDATTASSPHRDPHPLPTNAAVATLDYPDKLPESLVLQHPNDLRYQIVDRDSAVCDCDSLSPNGVVLSDNYYALHRLLAQGVKASLVYLDPPFATGMDFQSRAQEHAYADRMGEAAYLEFMRRRLILLRELLSEDGSIYLHIGHQMLGHLKALMDEVFGRRNFRNIITRKKCSSKNFTKKQFANIHDYILFYTKSGSYKWNQPSERPDDEWIEREYTKSDEKGKYKLVPIHAPGIRNGETGEAWRGMNPPRGKHWQYRPSTLEELDKRGDIHWSSNGNPRRKVYLEEDKLLALTDYWAKFRDAHHQSIKVTGYPTEKNLDMLKMIVAASSDEGDLVVDPFCGSGTTLEAAESSRRVWLGIDESFAAIKSTIGRLRHGSEAMGDFVERREPPKRRGAPELFPPLGGTSEVVCAPGREEASFNFYVDAQLLDRHGEEVGQIARI